MSQRLHIGTTDAEFYDCIITNNNNPIETYDKILADFLMYTEGSPFFLGPWKIRISNLVLFRDVDPILKKIFNKLGKNYPDCIWFFYYAGNSIEHPTRKELDTWLELQKIAMQ